MKLDEKFLYEPKCFEMLVSATGLLSGIQRRERIIAIAKRNIWLAARCKNTCINEEDDHCLCADDERHPPDVCWHRQDGER